MGRGARGTPSPGVYAAGSSSHEDMLPRLSPGEGSQAGRPPSVTGTAAAQPRLPLSSLWGSGWFFPHRWPKPLGIFTI